MRRIVITALIFVAFLCLCSFSMHALLEEAVARLGIGKLDRYNEGIAFSPDGAMLAVATSLGIHLYNTDTQAEIALLENTPRNTTPFSHLQFRWQTVGLDTA